MILNKMEELKYEVDEAEEIKKRIEANRAHKKVEIKE